MKHIFDAIKNKIQQDVPEIRWIDMDEGQLMAFEEAIPCDFPCVLIDFPQVNFDDLGNLAQLANVNNNTQSGF